MPKTIPAVTMPNYFDEAKQSFSGQATPLEILDSAAKQLAGQTNGLVTGSVYVATYLGSVRYTFNMVMPRLNGYTDPLFYVMAGPAGYPVTVIEAAASNASQTPCGNADELITCLDAIFNSGWARARIAQWVEMAEERG